MENNPKPLNDRKMAMVIAKIMRWGIAAAISLAFLGGVIFLLIHSSEKFDYHIFKEKQISAIAILRHTFNGISSGEGSSFTMLGILLLFATPIIRVLFSLIGFIIEKDRLYILITLVVLGIILISISGGLAA